MQKQHNHVSASKKRKRKTAIMHTLKNSVNIASENTFTVMHLHSIYSTNNWKGVKITENMQSTFVKYNIAKIYTFQLTKNAIIKQKLDV